MSSQQNLVTSVKVEIDAPASLVWDVLTDLAQYPQWNPYTVKVESTLKMGEPVNLFLPNPAAPGELLHVIEHLVAFDRPTLLSWEMIPSAGNPDAARRDQVVEATGEASCTYYSTDLFLGPTAPVVMATHGEWVRMGFDAVARSLKVRAESLYQAARATQPG
jgi:hypothetical protein